MRGKLDLRQGNEIEQLGNVGAAADFGIMSESGGFFWRLGFPASIIPSSLIPHPIQAHQELRREENCCAANVADAGQWHLRVCCHHVHQQDRPDPHGRGCDERGVASDLHRPSPHAFDLAEESRVASQSAHEKNESSHMGVGKRCADLAYRDIDGTRALKPTRPVGPSALP